MEAWLIPISFFSKKYLSINTLAIVPLMLYSLMLVIVILRRPKSLDDFSVSKKSLLFVLFFLAVQTIVIFVNFNKVKSDPGSPNLFSGVFFGLYLIVYNIIVDSMLVRILITDNDQEQSFIKSVYWSFIFYGILVLLPQLLFVVFNIGSQWINFIGNLFEERHTGRSDFYFNGSYTTTLKRINGFCAEASFLAAQIGIVFLPLILASIKNNFDLFHNKFSQRNAVNWIFLLLFWIVLLFAKTSTGILVIILSLLILFVTSNLFKKVQYIVSGAISLVVLVGAYITVSPLRNIINNYLLHKGGVSNRLGGTIGLLITFLHHPLFGVGNGYESYYLMKYVPKFTTHNWEFNDIFMKSGYPVQSEFVAFFAHYGIIIMIPVCVYVFKKLYLAHKLKVILTSEVISVDTARKVTLIDSFYYFVFMYFIISLFSFTWYNNYFLIMFFFFITMLNNEKYSGRFKKFE